MDPVDEYRQQMGLPERDRIRYGVRVGKDDTGWWAEKGRPTRSGSRGDGMYHGSFWDVVRFFVIPNAYHVWKYKRQQRERAAR